MKKAMVIAAMAGLLLTGCGTTEKSEEYWNIKANCVKNTYKTVEDGNNPIIKTWKQLDENCGKSADLLLKEAAK